MQNAGVAQLVERNLAKVEVASSRLVSRSRTYEGGRISPFFLSSAIEKQRFAWMTLGKFSIIAPLQPRDQTRMML